MVNDSGFWFLQSGFDPRRELDNHFFRKKFFSSNEITKQKMSGFEEDTNPTYPTSGYVAPHFMYIPLREIPTPTNFSESGGAGGGGISSTTPLVSSEVFRGFDKPFKILIPGGFVGLRRAIGNRPFDLHDISLRTMDMNHSGEIVQVSERLTDAISARAKQFLRRLDELDSSSLLFATPLHYIEDVSTASYFGPKEEQSEIVMAIARFRLSGPEEEGAGGGSRPLPKGVVRITKDDKYTPVIDCFDTLVYVPRHDASARTVSLFKSGVSRLLLDWQFENPISHVSFYTSKRPTHIHYRTTPLEVPLRSTLIPAAPVGEQNAVGWGWQFDGYFETLPACINRRIDLVDRERMLWLLTHEGEEGFTGRYESFEQFLSYIPTNGGNEESLYAKKVDDILLGLYKINSREDFLLDSEQRNCSSGLAYSNELIPSDILEVVNHPNYVLPFIYVDEGTTCTVTFEPILPDRTVVAFSGVPYNLPLNAPSVDVVLERSMLLLVPLPTEDDETKRAFFQSLFNVVSKGKTFGNYVLFSMQFLRTKRREEDLSAFGGVSRDRFVRNYIQKYPGKSSSHALTKYDNVLRLLRANKQN